MVDDSSLKSSGTTGAVIDAFAQTQPDHAAIASPGRPDLSYARLSAFISDTRSRLNAVGIGRGDRVALAVQSRPEMAVAHLCVSNAATSLPIDAKTPPNEIETILLELDATALITCEDLPATVYDRVVSLGIQILMLHPRTQDAAGLFGLVGGMVGPTVHPGPAEPDDIASVMRTSGTSSAPKAVPISHRLAVARGRIEAAAFGISRADRCLNFRPLHLHSALNAGLMVPLSAGGTVFLPLVFDPTEFFPTLESSRATWFLGSPAYFSAILEALSDRPITHFDHNLRFVRSSSFRLPPESMRELEALFGVPFLERLGGTEAGLIARNPPPPAERRADSVGQMVDSEVALLDGEGHVRLLGETDEMGEIIVRGEGVFSGYENDAEATAQAFVDGWFRTGDLGRFDADGFLTVCGRVKEVINRGGQKISPLEVEAAILELENVRDAVCFPIAHETLGEDIAAAIVLRDRTQGPSDLETLHAEIGAEFTAHKLPKRLLVCDELPRNPTGKIARRGLAGHFNIKPLGQVVSAREQAGDISEGPFASTLRAIWRDILKTDTISDNQNFFSLGGDSLMAARLLSRVSAQTGVQLPVDCVFAEGGTIRGMGALINHLKNAPPTMDKSAVTDEITVLEPSAPAPLSFSQKRLRFLSEVDPNSHIYNMQGAVRLTGKLDADVLRKALNEIVARHDILRARFPIIDGELCQEIIPHLELDLPIVDMSDIPPSRREKALLRLALDEAQKPYDLNKGPLIRAKLVLCSPTEHVLLLPKHHMVFDGQSGGVLYNEIAELYAAFSKGLASPLDPLPVQFKDYASWQKSRLSGARMDREVSYWMDHLRGAPPLLDLPTDKPRPTVQTYKGGRCWFTLPEELNDKVKAFSRTLGVTHFITLLSAFQLLLHRFSGQDDFVLGTIVGGRIRPELDDLLGLFVNTLALRARFEGVHTVSDHVNRVKKAAVGAYAHQEMPFDRLVDELNPNRNAAFAPVVQVLFGLMPKDLRRVELDELTFERMNVDLGTARFDLSVMIGEDHGALEGFFEFSEDLFERNTIEKLIRYFETVLDEMTNDPQASLASISFLTPKQQSEIANAWRHRREAIKPPTGSIATRFRDMVACSADSIALVCNNETFTYAQLDAWSDAIAERIRAASVPVGSILAIPALRTPETIAAMLGVLKAGCAYLPLNLDLPKARRNFMLSDSKAARMLLPEEARVDVDDQTVEVLRIPGSPRGDTSPRTFHDAPAHPENLAYVMYTSGSTGQPKGVLTPQAAVLRLVVDATYADFSADQVFLHLASPAFDAATFEIWGALLNGGRLVLIPEAVPSLSDIARAIRENRVTTAWFTAGLFHEMVDSNLETLSKLDQLLTGGDVLSREHVARFVRANPYGRLINGYGPTENTTFTTTYQVPSDFAGDRAVPIGQPVDGTCVYILDEDGKVVPDGIPGEIHAGGTGVARGYLGRYNLTKQQFVKDPFSTFPDARMYRTGDKGRWRADGNLEFLGRLDNQVKINGFRIELGEIEAVLRSHPQVRDAMALVTQMPSGSNALVAFLVEQSDHPAHGGSFEPEAVLAYVKDQLPSYMVPSKLHVIDSLPLNQSGKVDRKTLAEKVSLANESIAKRHIPARTPVEMLLAGIWSEVLKKADIGVDDNFFEIGGNSLMSMKVFFRISQELSSRQPVSLIFSHPTIRELAIAITRNLIKEEETLASAISE